VHISRQTALNNQRSRSCSKRIALPQFHTVLFLAALICLTCIPASAGRKHQSQPTGVDFGDVTVGTSSTQTVVVTNSGHSNATISAATVTGSGFNYMGPALPVTLSRGQSVNLTISFAPSAAGVSSGNLSLSTSGNVSPNGIPLTGTGVQSQQTLLLTVSPQSVSFGNVPVGSNGSQTVSLLNTGNGPVNVSQATMAGNGFGMTGLALPITLGPGQSSAFTVSFAPAGAGSASGNISVVSNAANSVSTVALSGMGVQPQISVAPGSVSFGAVTVGQTSSQAVTLTNAGGAPLNITQLAGPGTGFSLTGLALPLTLAPGKSTAFTVSFTPTSGASSSSSLMLVSNAPTSPTTIPLSGAGSAQVLQLTPSTTALSFGNQTLNASATQSVTLTNTGNSAVSISQVNVAGTGFSLNGSAPLVTLSAGQAASFSVTFTPTVAGNATGSVSVISTAANSPMSISLAGVGVQPQISVVPGAVTFSTVTVGQTNSQTITLSNPGTATLTVTQSAGPGTGFGLTGLALPLTLAPGKSTAFTVSFTPTSGTNSSSSLTLVSNAPNSPTTIPLSGTGLAPVLQLTPSTTSLSFGSQTLNASATQSVTLTNTGNAAVSISQVNVTGTGFTLSGSAPLVTLSPGQAASFSVTFTPTAAGSDAGSASVVSTAANSPLSMSLSGSGAQPHFVSLAWSETSSGVVGYNVYSSTQPSGPYSRLNPAPVGTMAYTDNTVQSGQTYYYCVTALDSSGDESAFSSDVAVTIP
jgi:Cep192 domain 4/Abnormal spindle-like microcephaly-assoc'd, ASPM-SPD-2-Hydin/HYDIN/CFA65/VesB-like, Ig-like domain